MVFTRVFRLWQKFCTNRRGNISLMVAMCAIPLVGFIGLGVDYGRALAVQQALQASVDTTALMVAQTGSSMTSAQLQTAAQTYLAASFYKDNTTTPTVLISSGSGTSSKSYVLNATTTMKTSFMQVMGVQTLPVRAYVTAQAASTARNRVALVLDNSGSMSSSGKMTALKSAANSFLTDLQGASTTAADTYVSIIPFVEDVNIGSSNASATWMDWSEWNSGSFSGSGNGNGSSCNGLNLLTNWANCLASLSGKSTSLNHSSWGGCVADRGNTSGPASQAYDTNVLPPVLGNSASLFPADLPSSCPVAVVPLSNDWTALSAKVNAMVASGSTNQNIGLAHGWLSLMGGGPYPTPPVEETGYAYQKIIIILSDGLNTVNRWYSSQSSIDARQLMTCINIKAAGITIYSIQVNTGGDPTSSILQSCATDSSKFYQISSSAQISNVFSSISGQLNAIRLTQ